MDRVTVLRLRPPRFSTVLQGRFAMLGAQALELLGAVASFTLIGAIALGLF